MKTWFAAVAACISLGLALAACGSTAHTQGSSSQRSQLEAVVQCLRAHGVPNFPDPVYDPSSGNWRYGNYSPTIPQSAEQACQHLEPSTGNQSPPVSRAQFAVLVQFANCMRHNGEPTWPDPRPDGVFALPSSLLRKPDPVGEHAVDACKKYLPTGHYNAVRASS